SLCQVRIRYKAVDAESDAPAIEMSTDLPREAIVEVMDTASGELQWAAAVAGFAEILKGSPFASEDALPRIQELVDANAGTDADRIEFRTLLADAAALLAPEDALEGTEDIDLGE
ncbi:MAG: DUF3520 domain-containing protein, partial [Myxococcota bacterium]|nr:DUF3520 domain-containing protein [Myxococcota bacterium]